MRKTIQALSALGLLFAATAAYADGQACVAANTLSVSESAGQASVAITRSTTGSGQASVSYRTVAGTATPAIDYTDTAGTVVWEDGDLAAKTVLIPINNNTSTDGNRTFTLQLTTTTSMTLCAAPQAQVTIVDDETSSAGTLRFTTSEQSVAEGAGTGAFQVERVGGSRGAVTVTVSLSGSSATRDSDYTYSEQKLTWADGEVGTKSGTFTLIDDAAAEGNEYFSLYLSSVSGDGQLASPSSQNINILDNDSAEVSQIVFSNTPYQVIETGGVVQITLTRTGGSKGVAAVNYNTVAGSAKPTEDYASSTGTVSWADGEAGSKTLLIQILDDSVAEATENFVVTLTAVNANTQVPAATANVDIIDNEKISAGTVSLLGDRVSVRESAGDLVLPVVRQNGKDGRIAVSYTTVSGSATAGADFADPSGSLVWEDGDTATKEITIPLLDDGALESSETFQVILTNPQGGTSITPVGTTQVTILDDESTSTGTIVMSAPASSIKEDGSSVVIAANRVNGDFGPASVTWETAAGTATANADYIQSSGTISWGAGESGPKKFSIPIINDTLAESTETFTVTLANPSNAGLGSPSSTTVSLLDDETPSPGVISIVGGPYSAAESGGVVAIRVTRNGGSSGKVSVKLQTFDGSAKVSDDAYRAVSTTVMWEDGVVGEQQVLVPILDDDLPEGDQSFSVAISDPTGNVALETFQATINIVDDDSAIAANIALATEGFSVAETNPAVVTVTRSGSSRGRIAVSYATRDQGTAAGAATAGADYRATNGQLIWEDGDATPKTIEVVVLDDAESESKETFFIDLKDPACYMTTCQKPVLVAPSTAAVTILDDDGSDVPPGKLYLNTIQQSINEGNSSNTLLQVYRGDGAKGRVGVSYVMQDNTATAPQDYMNNSGVLVWEDGDTTPKAIPLRAETDSIVEGDENFTVTLMTPTGGAELAEPKVATVKIIDKTTGGPVSVGTIRLMTERESVSEAAPTYTVRAIREGGSSGKVRVTLRTADGTAFAGSDYNTAEIDLVWADGEAGTKAQSIQIINDEARESTEVFYVDLVNPVSLDSADKIVAPSPALGTSRTSVEIVDDEATCDFGRLVFENPDISVYDNAGSVLVRVGRTGGSCGAVSMSYEVAPGTAQPVLDYTTTSAVGEVVWANGELGFKQVPVSSIGLVRQTQLGPTKEFYVRITGASPNGVATTENAQARIRIKNSIGESGATGGGAMGVDMVMLLLGLAALRRLRSCKA